MKLYRLWVFKAMVAKLPEHLQKQGMAVYALIGAGPNHLSLTSNPCLMRIRRCMLCRLALDIEF